MIDIYEIHLQMGELHNKLDDLEKTLDIEKLEEEIESLNSKTEEPDFWNNPDEAQKVLKRVNILKSKTDKWKSVAELVDDLDVMLELIEEGEEVGDFEKELKNCQEEMETFRLETLLNGEYDANNAIIAFHPGSGGTESNDWSEMLLRMYTRWAESRGFKIKTLDLQPGSVAGVKSATLLIEGVNAYGYLKNERGVHRLVRISPFDSSGRRHTSFASLDVTPEVDESATRS